MTKAPTPTMTLDGSNEDTLTAFVTWVRTHKGADAHIIYNSIDLKKWGIVRGPLNGVTVQWDHDGDGNADEAIHVRPGQTLTIDRNGKRIESS